MITAGFHHAGLVAADAQRTIRFYRDLLGFSLLQSSDSRLIFGDHLAAPGTLLWFAVQPDARSGRWGVGGIHHVAFGVATDDAQLKWKRWLTDYGISVSGPYDRGWFHSIYFADADGQILEIATHGPGYDVDEPIGQLGQRVVMPSESQLRGHRDEAAIAARTFPEPVNVIDGSMQLDGIHHITGLTNDVAMMGEFYEDALGLRLVKRSVNQDDPSTPHLFWANYDGTRVAKHSSLTMFGWPSSTYHSRPGPGQVDHVAFRAANDAELQQWSEHLRALRISVSDVADHGLYRAIRFRAPDGLQMEIATDA